MRKHAIFLHFFLGVLAYLSCVSLVNAEDPYVYLNWVVEYGEAAPLGVKQRVNSSQSHIN